MFAALMGWEYQLVDWQWYGPPFAEGVGGGAHPTSDITTCEPEIDVPALVKYAADKNVKLFVWCHWKHIDQQMDKAFPLYEKWGVAGVKIDFMDRDDQEMVNYYRRVVTKAAEQATATVMANAWGETPSVSAAPMAMGATTAAVAVLEMKQPMTAVTMNRIASMTTGPAMPRSPTRYVAMRSAAPDF